MKLKFLNFILIAGIFIGCGVRSGNTQLENKSISQISKKLIKGKTTQAEVKALFGEPQSVGMTPNGEVYWSYTYLKANPTAATYIPVVGAFVGGSKSKIKTLTIYFDKKGVVKNYSFISQKQTTHVTPF